MPNSSSWWSPRRTVWNPGVGASGAGAAHGGMFRASGGCGRREGAGEVQGGLKGQTVVDAMRRIAGIDAAAMVPPIHQFGEGWGYRHRVRLHATWAGDAWLLGYYERRSRKLVPLVT